MQQEHCWQATCHLTAGQLVCTPTERRGLNGRLDVISAVHKADPTECNRTPHTHTLARICNLMALDLSARSGSLPLTLLLKHQCTHMHTHTHTIKL